MAELYSAYRVTNSANGKCYIGITSRAVRRRWQEHLSHAKRGRGGYLHAAMRKYGAESFFVVTVAQSKDWRAICCTESALIDQWAAWGKNGYNAAPGLIPITAHQRAHYSQIAQRPCSEAKKRHLRKLFKGRKDSPETLARKRAAQAQRVADGGNRHMKGKKLSPDVLTVRSERMGGPGTVRYAGVEYASPASAARAAGVTPHTMRRWIEKLGTDMPEVTKEMRRALRWPNAKPVEILGRSYPSISAAARDLGVAHDAISRYLQTGRIPQPLREE